MRAYFGERYPSDERSAPIYENLPAVPVPVGWQCLYCEEGIEAGDRGFLMDLVQESWVETTATHHECFMRQIIGSVAHIQHLCTCAGGDHGDDPKLTRREAAKAALAEFERRKDGH